MNRPDEHDEFLLSRLLDGDLSDDEAAALHARLEREPELRSLLDALTRIDTLLADRRDERPAVNWARFHARVMDQVSDQSALSGRTLRFPRWLRVTVPIAVAAGIALVVTVRQLPQMIQDSPAPSVQVAYRTPAPDQAGRIVVEYNRNPAPAHHDRAAQKQIQVAYAQSNEQQEVIKKYDEARKNRPLWHIYAVHSSAPAPAGDVLFDISAL